MALLLLQQPEFLDLPAVENNPFTSPADLDQGKKLYGGRCAGCHGPAGDGGKGANLAVPILPRAADDIGLYRVIRYGIPDSEMPNFNMAQREIWQVAAFVRTLGRLPREPISGDVTRGEQLVRGKGGCLQCHGIGRDGGHLGPALSDIGTRRSPAHLRGKLLNASSDIPDQFRVVRMTTPSGQKVLGIRLNEDLWSIQVRDFSGRLHSYWKQDLTELQLERRTPMPSYKERFDARELNDVVAYLTSLRGDQ